MCGKKRAINMIRRSAVVSLLHIFTFTIFAHCAQLPIRKDEEPPAIQSTSAIREPIVLIQCLSASMLITIKHPPLSHDDGLFSGMIYPKGLSKNSSCLTEYRGHDGPLKYKLPLRSCNTMPQETEDGDIDYFNTIVLQAHLKLVTDMGRGYHVRCRYKSRDAAMTVINKSTAAVPSEHKRHQQLRQHRGSQHQQPAALTSADGPAAAAMASSDRRGYGRSLDLEANALAETVETSNDNDRNNDDIDIIGDADLSDGLDDVPMPGCHMKIFSGDDVAKNVKIGDPLKLMVTIDRQNVYGLHVTDCLVRDGLGWGEQTLVNSFGCPLDGEIMGQFEYSADRSEATVAFPAHKFPYTASVYYQCNVQLCALADPACQQSPSCGANRSKRDANDDNDEGHPATIEVYSGLYVNENAEIIDGEDSVFAEKTPEDALCVSQRTFAIAIAVAGLILMLAVVAAVLCIMARRHRKTVSHSGSSIYSGPYTNTAFSHSS